MKRQGVILLAAAAVSLIAYLAIALLSRQFVYGEGHLQRPIVTVLALFGVAFVCYLAALGTAVRLPQGRWLLAGIVAPAVLFRLALLFSEPIQEVDIYRYLWDGAVGGAGVSPFRYSPDQVLSALPEDELPDDLVRLVELRDASPAMATILQRVHFRALPTIYPPVSQAVFRLADWLTPRGASVRSRIVIMKSVLTVFDLATLGLVLGLLGYTGRHPGWSVAYAWCPLLMKEVANSGHLDAIAVFLCTLGVYLAVRALYGRPNVAGSLRDPSTGHGVTGPQPTGHGVTGPQPTGHGVTGPRSTSWSLIATSALVLALGVGAKVYPAVLAPLIIITCWKRLGWRPAVTTAAVFVATAALVIWPMLPRKTNDVPLQSSTAPQDPSLGLKTFIQRWEMNDFVFMLVVENLKPSGDLPPERRPWFLALPEAWRDGVTRAMTRVVDLQPWEAGFLLARLLTGLTFVILALWLAIRARAAEPADWLRVAFLTLAWFWLLSPSQNPWYWSWALPLLAFARGRAWLAVSGLAMLYYLRFWFGYQWPQTPVPGSPYAGELFFDFVVTWVEYAPWFVWLAVEALWLKRRSECPQLEPLRAMD